MEDPRDGTKLDIPAVDYLLDTMLFQDSKKSLGIQMADYANFFYKMHMMRRPDAERFYLIIEPLFKMDGIFYARKI
jgi:hypothetical protein